jgi:hypothetical protein
MQQLPLIGFDPAPFNGPYGLRSQLLASATAAPFEGLWTPIAGAKVGSIEVNGTESTIEVDIYATNNPSASPSNTYTVTVGGSATQNDVVGLTFTNPLLPNGSESVSYTVGATPSLTTVAAGLVAAILADTKLQALGFGASNLAGVITITWPSVSPQSIAGGDPYATPSTPVMGSTTAISTTLSGGATETLTATAGTDGFLLTKITALGFTLLTMPARFIKARLVTLTGSSPSVNAFYNGAA